MSVVQVSPPRKLAWGIRTEVAERRMIAAGVSRSTLYAARRLAYSGQGDLIEQGLLGLVSLTEATRRLRQGVDHTARQIEFVGRMWSRLPSGDREAMLSLMTETLVARRGNGNGAVKKPVP
jgi:hypothetical protein